jgi:hypothetical protein
LKKEKKIKNVILYSNNNNDVFIGIVLSFIHETLNYNLFDTIISINQTHNKNKNITDLLNYSNGLLNKNSSIFFIDDKEYQDMKSIQYYIKCESYKYVYSKLEIEQKLNIIIPINRDKKIISQSIYAYISKEIINKIRLFVLINL